MRRLRQFTVLATLLMLASACITVGHKFDLAKVDLLTPGASTIDDATRLLGEPSAESDMPDGTKLFQWQYSQGTALGTGSASHVAILFGADGKMIRVSHRSHTTVH
jgi:hypothetical protein